MSATVAVILKVRLAAAASLPLYEIVVPEIPALPAAVSDSDAVGATVSLVAAVLFVNGAETLPARSVAVAEADTVPSASVWASIPLIAVGLEAPRDAAPFAVVALVSTRLIVSVVALFASPPSRR